MTFQLFMFIFFILEILTPLIVEACKKFLDAINYKYNSTVLALVVAIVASFVLGIFFYMQNDIPLTALNSLYLVYLMIANWLGSTLGYDTVKKAFNQFSK